MDVHLSAEGQNLGENTCCTATCQLYNKDILTMKYVSKSCCLNNQMLVLPWWLQQLLCRLSFISTAYGYQVYQKRLKVATWFDPRVVYLPCNSLDCCCVLLS